MHKLEIKICNSAAEAPNYNTNGEGIKSATLVKAIVVRNGTVNGCDTVDLQFKDETGQVYIAMTTGALLEQLTSVINAK